MDYLISQYPVTQDYIQRLSKNTGKPLEPVVVSTLTARGYISVFKNFRRLNSEAVYIPVTDVSSEPLLAPLQILAMLVRTGQRQIVLPDFSFRPFGWGDALLGGWRIALGMMDGLFTIGVDWVRLGRLINVPRIQVPGMVGHSILYLKTNLWFGVQAGGSIVHTSGVVKGFLEKGCEIKFASVETPIAMPENDALTFIQVVPKGAYIIPREFNHYRHNPLFIDAATSWLDDFDGAIYQRLSLGNYAGVSLSRRHGLPLIIEYNGSENWLANNWGTPLSLVKLAMRAEKACLKHAHLLVTVSDVLRDELIERGVEPERIVTHPNGVNTDLFDSDRFSEKDIRTLRSHYQIPKDSVVITFVGTFGPWHGAEVFAKALILIITDGLDWVKAHKLHFLFIGDGVRRPVVESLVSDPQFKSYVTIAGLIDQDKTPLHLAASDILVSPHVRNPDGSPFFGSPTKLFEYLSSGRAVIGSDLNQIGEVLQGCPRVGELDDLGNNPEEGACGLLVEPENADTLAEAIRFLAENSEWRMAAGRNARMRALEHYTWGHHVGAILEGVQGVHALEQVSPSQPVRLLFNALHSKSGGGLTYLNNILPLMAQDRNIDLHLCIHEDQRNLLPEFSEKITVHILDFPQGFWRLQWAEQFEVPKLAKRIGTDVTFSPANYGPLWAPNSVILLRNALSVAFVERRPVKLGYWALVYIGTFLSLLTSRRAITVSDYARRAASGGLTGMFGNRFTVVPHGVSEIYSPPDVGARREEFLLAVSDLYVQKNFKNLISAFSHLIPQNPDLVLKIAGRPVDVEYFQELKDMIADMEIDGKVEFLGGVSSSELVGLYQQCIVFVFPSTVETFGNPLVEAMASGAPIASSQTAAMPEVVGDAAVFFDPANVENMTAVLDDLLNDDDLRRKLSLKAVKRARKFSWQKTAKKTLDVIKLAGTT